MAILPEETLNIIQFLKKNGIDPILYGSQGVSLYLGEFKEFKDLDLLVGEEFLSEQWSFLRSLMEGHGFKLINLREHEFQNDDKVAVAFASEQILIRDGILSALSEIHKISIDDVDIRTLSRADFIKAYEFSKKDGYRKEARGKNDSQIISMLESGSTLSSFRK